MKNHREIAGVFANILIVVAILLFIVLGLNKIGVYDLPDAVEKLVGTYNEDTETSDKSHIDNDSPDFTFDGTKTVSEAYELDYSNALELLEGVSAVDDYSQTVTYSSFYDTASLTKSVSLSRKGGLYSAYIYGADNKIVQEISEAISNVTIISYLENEPVEATFERGSFDISDECGFVISVEGFLDSGFKLDEATFSVFENEYGTALKVTFVNTVDTVTFTESYTLSLDFGVVLSADCYENETLVYSMVTDELSR